MINDPHFYSIKDYIDQYQTTFTTQLNQYQATFTTQLRAHTWWDDGVPPFHFSTTTFTSLALSSSFNNFPLSFLCCQRRRYIYSYIGIFRDQELFWIYHLCVFWIHSLPFGFWDTCLNVFNSSPYVFRHVLCFHVYFTCYFTMVICS